MHTLSIVIPAFNEEPRLGRTLNTIRHAFQGGALPDIRLDRIIVADDGSTDATVEVAEGFAESLPITVVRLPHNRGKGAAVRAGMRLITGDFALIYDADGAAPIAEVPKLFNAILERKADIAIGSRVLGHSEGIVTMRRHRRFIGRTYHLLCSLLVPGIRDTACGCKLFRREAAETLFRLQRIDRFSFDVEVLAIALRRGYKVVEVPLHWVAVPESKVRLIRDGIQMFRCLVALYVRRMMGRL
ncbi:MAG: glycosyltransferase family 2 protein [Candidatus Peribacteraceae bacterium]|nr:glycosyltransferase family 2 protein [Candidatus Peribacteraceae bacterium]